MAIDAGVDSLEHAFQATDAQLQAMKDKGIFMVATDIPDNGGSTESKDRLQRAMKIGVKIATGSDLWFVPSAGMTYGQAALKMGWSDLIGEIAPGKLADIIALVADPLEDVSSLQHVAFVMNGAAVVRNEFPKH